MVHKAWSLRAPGAHIDLELVSRPTAMDDSVRAETRLLIGQIGQELRVGDHHTRRVVLDICSTLGANALHPLHGRTRASDSSSANWESFTEVLMRAAEMGTLVARRRNLRRVVVPLESPAEVLGPEPDSAPEPDVYVLAAEVKLIGDTPLIKHEVRVIDPDTGEIVADGLTTDENGIVRTDVPKNKKYRIEIVDDDPDRHHFRTIKVPHPMLRCAFVDIAGSPVPYVDVKVKGLDGIETEHTADENGLLEMGAELGLYEVTVGEDDSHWVHSLLHTDGADDAYQIVVPSELEDGGDGIDPGDRLTRSWEYEDDIEDDDDEDDVDGALV